MSEEINRWVKFMKENPSKWKKIHTEFIDAQFIKSDNFLKRLLKEKDGEKRISSAFNIKNKKVIESLR